MVPLNLATSTRSAPRAPNTSASTTCRPRPALSTWGAAPQALALPRAQQVDLEFGGDHHFARSAPGLGRAAGRVVGQRADHAGMHHAAMLQVARRDRDRDRGFAPARAGIDELNAQVGNEGREREDARDPFAQLATVSHAQAFFLISP